MAVSASISIEQVSQNIANNTSSIKVVGIMTTTGGSHNLNTLTGTVTIDGASQNFTCTLPYTTTTTLFSITKTITHNTDGTRSVSASFTLDTRISAGVVTGSATKTLTTIPRATTPSLSPSSVIMGEDISISLPRASSAFTHTLQHDFLAGTWTTFATDATTSAILTTLTEWTEKLPDAEQGTGKIRCLTYNGTTLIGEKTVNFIAKVPDDVVPTVDTITVTEGTEGIAEKFESFIQSKSTLKVVSEASGVQGSSILKYVVEVLGKSYDGADVITDIINISGNTNITVTVTDSRGRTASKTVSVNLLEYFTPTISKFDAFRSDLDGIEENGSKNLNCVYTFEIASCDDKNDKSYIIEYKRDTETDWIAITSGSLYEANSNYIVLDLLELEYSYNVRLTVTDFFTSTVYELKVGTEIVPLCVYPTGKGLGIGGYPTKEALEVFFPTEFNDTLKIMGIELINLIHPVGDVIFNASAEFDPNELWVGTTWKRIKGRMPIGVDEDDEDFASAGLTGGEKTHTLTTTEMPSHNHSFKDDSHTFYWGQSSCNVYCPTSAVAGTPSSNYLCTKQGTWTSTNTTGNGVAHNNMPPYETFYMWERTA